MALARLRAELAKTKMELVIVKKRQRTSRGSQCEVRLNPKTLSKQGQRLLANGIRVGKERVRKLMQQHGMTAKHKKRYVITTDSRHKLPIAPT